ncbi:MAG: tRNA (uridine(34)/cytosine(34)/5-carboxymethylaminomethyluridine(34)-2'-O)-methyltransferase TrmL [Pseudomonadales bacterium]|nr:tRNA (uridine(34)/cytosine(34)/5-carboxymethylaminomethyluridine(34)-2'-O)-methyltransferase TrmL [Pseudomonadales bacterium]
MFNVVLFQPEIPPNTGNVIRLCANTGVHLHLVHPLGFAWDDRRLRRAGLDYHEWARVSLHENWAACLAALGNSRLFAFTTRGDRPHHEVAYRSGDSLLFGPETRGLPEDLLATLPAAHRLRIPMQATSRSLNLSNAVAVAVYEAWRQQGFRR